MLKINTMQILPRSLIRKDGKQRLDLYYTTDRAGHVFLSVYDGEQLYADKQPVALNSGEGHSVVYLPCPAEGFQARFVFTDKAGSLCLETTLDWQHPREWDLYVMVSAHTDIGLHNSQYIQRYNSEKFLDMAMELCDRTAHLAPENQYRFTMEGTWFWSNYPDDRGDDAAEKVVEKYIKTNKLGVFTGIAGNHTQVYGLEEMCRSTYSRRWLRDKWKTDSRAMSMIDNNGLTWGMVQPYAEAGIEHIFFAPNHWNPLPSTVWKMDRRNCYGEYWNPQAAGGGARCDVRYDSALPMVFWWQGADADSRMLVWAGTQYHWAGYSFGLPAYGEIDIDKMEDTMAEQLSGMEKQYPYDIWLFASYQDDQAPDMHLNHRIQEWNNGWQYPKIQILANVDEPFDRLKERYGDQIPVLRGDITGGWYQHPITAPDLLADKYNADRALPWAEELASLASLYGKNYTYPAADFNHAWAELLMNDEHSYGTSGYKGRQVYETWMQHRAWIENAANIGAQEAKKALQILAEEITASTESYVVWNPTARERTELLPGAGQLVTVPAFGYITVPADRVSPAVEKEQSCIVPPVVENRYYRLCFTENGGIASLYDKELDKELLAEKAGYAANTFVYTKDNHNTYHVPQKAAFTVTETEHMIRVVCRMNHPESGAAIVQTVILPDWVKRVDIDNRLEHVSDMVNTNRYKRFAYYAFPFAVDAPRRYCHLNGTVAEYARDITGHGTDVYMAASEWCAVENGDLGIGIAMPDSSLVEFDHIHPDKTDFGDTGEGSALYCYVANDWLQMHLTGGNHLHFRFRYAITSYTGTYASAGVPEMAEQFTALLQVIKIQPRSGILPSAHSFLTLPEGVRLLNLKRAYDGDGLIVRLYSQSPITSEVLQPALPGVEYHVRRNTVDEYPMEDIPSAGFVTLRIAGPRIDALREEIPLPPLSIGDRYTGLIDKPRAFRGENDGQLYLLWGKCNDPELDHYELYRGTAPDFVPVENCLIARVQPEEYCVGRYIETDLETHKAYYYTVRAVNRTGEAGPFSEIFCGITGESES